MAYYRVCSCGDHLDPGEKCERCEVTRREITSFTDKMNELLGADNDGQVFMRGILDENVRRAI